MHKFELKPREGAEDRISVGATMQLYIDGKLAKGVQRVEIEVGAAEIATIKVSYVGKISAEGFVHEIGSYQPTLTKAWDYRKAWDHVKAWLR